MPEVVIPRFIATPKLVWVECEEARSVSPRESACLVRGVGGSRIVIGFPEYFDVENGLVRGVKVGTAGDDETKWLVDLPSGERVLVPEEMVRE